MDDEASNHGSNYSGPSTTYSAPAAVGLTIIQENPQQEVELKMVAAELINVLTVVGPMLPGDHNFGDNIERAVKEAYGIVQPGAITLPSELEPEMQSLVSCLIYYLLLNANDPDQILSYVGNINQRLLTYIKGRFPEDWRLSPLPSDNIVPGSQAEIKYKRDRIAFYLNDLRFMTAEVGFSITSRFLI